MKQRFTAMTGILMLPAAIASAAPQAIEIGPNNTADLPRGREADGIIGDFVLRNDRVEVLISGNQHERKANMGVMWSLPTPGCIYDFSFFGENNDQITWFGPGHQQGPLSNVFILKDGSDGEAIIRAEVSGTITTTLGRRHDYILRDGWQHIVVVSTYHNVMTTPHTFKPGPAWMGLTEPAVADGVTTMLCQDPSDRVGYAYGPAHFADVEDATNGNVEIGPGEKKTFASALAIGRGAAEAYSAIAGLAQKTHRFRGTIADTRGKPAAFARLELSKGDKPLVAYLDNDGRFDFSLPESGIDATVKEAGRPDVKAQLKSDADNVVTVPIAAAATFAISDEQGRPLPCKVQFIRTNELGPPWLGTVDRAHGCDNQYHSENGHFTQQLPTGPYKVIITHGPEFEHIERTFDLAAEQTVTIEAQLRRIVDTKGWVSTDFHNHSTPSGDNYCGTDDRLINLAAEHIEFAPGTEHNRIYDWQPHIDRLGLSNRLRTITGMELTGSGPHLNAFPLTVKRFRQDNGAPKWDPDPRISAMLLRRLDGDLENRWVHLNHPDVASYFNDRNGDKKADGGFVHLESFIDASEFWTGNILKAGSQDRCFAWLQMINAGKFIPLIAVSDAHKVIHGGVGGWRTYVKSSQDEPTDIDIPEILKNARAAKTFVTTGPFLEVSCGTGVPPVSDHRPDAGATLCGPGDTIASSNPVTLHVRVQCNTWADVDRVVVLVNGRIDPGLDLKRSEHPDKFRTGVVRFEQDLRVPLKTDAHLIVVAIGENSTLETAFGKSHESKWNPIAYHNPIFVDVDGNGFKPNGDTLDQPYLKYGEPGQ